jgi:hypothetical protein
MAVEKSRLILVTPSQYMSSSSIADGRIPTRSLNDAGFRSSSEPSSFSGVLHFWQYIVSLQLSGVWLQSPFMSGLRRLLYRLILTLAISSTFVVVQRECKRKCLLSVCLAPVEAR